MKKFFLTVSVFLLLTVFSCGRVSAQVNIIEGYDGQTLQNVINEFGANAWVVVTGEPENATLINVVNSYSFNWVVRGHAAWLSIGRDMLNNPAVAAQRWGSFFSRVSRTFYFEPWNEPEHPAECGGLSVDQCANRMIAFLQALQPYLDANPQVRLMTPAFDTLHSNHDALIQNLLSKNFFNRFSFEAVSYHIYGEQNITSYQGELAQWGVSGLPIVITESGALSGGVAAYIPNLLCLFYNQAVPVWQASGQARGWALFDRAPGDSGYTGWNLWAPEAECVRQALRGEQPDCATCGELNNGAGYLQSGLGRASLCPEIPLGPDGECLPFNPNVDCYYAPNLQQGCNVPVSLPEFGDTCQYDLRSSVTVVNPQTNPEGQEIINGRYTADLNEDWNQNGVPLPIANFFFALAKRPESNIPLNISPVVNGFDLGSANRGLLGRTLGARRDGVMIQAVTAHYDDSQGADFIIACAFVPEGGRVYAAPVTSATASCASGDRPVYASELACMNETQTYKAIAPGLRIEFLPFPAEVIEMCDRLYGADRFQTGRISPNSILGQTSGASGELLAFLPHIIANELWERLPAHAASSLRFTATIQERTEVGELGYGGGVVDASGFGNDRENRRTDFSYANNWIPQRELAGLDAQLAMPVNTCGDRVRQDYLATSTVRIRSIFEIIIEFINRAIDFLVSQDEEGNPVYQESQDVPVSAQATLDYPGFSPALEKYNLMFYHILPERVGRELKEAQDPAMQLKREQSFGHADQSMFLPKTPKGESVAETAHGFLWPERWKNSEFAL
ncbi:hypothetical protein KKD61_04790 [Patescibacteria group bacterium]|nr:hypothetical protein [Patescibacteria group bacterium]